MKIKSISNNYCKSNFTKMKYHSVNFKGGYTPLNTYEIHKLLDMFKPVISQTILCENNDDFIKATEEMINKKVKGSLGVLLITNDERNYCLRNELSDEKLNNYECVCIATGDKIGPMSSWNTAYDAKLVLLTPAVSRAFRLFPPC